MGPAEWVQAVKASSSTNAPAINKRTGRRTADQLSRRADKFFIKQASREGGANVTRSRIKAAMQ